MTVFHLVRHGSYSLLGGSVLAGRETGHGLDARGLAEASRVAAALGGRPVAIVASGPLERARETASPLACRLGRPLRIEPGLDELDYGDWTGRDWTTLEGDPAWLAWNAHRGTASIPGGETIGAVADRAVGVLRRLSGELGGEGEVALFTHAEIVRTVLAAALGLASDLALRIAVDPGSRAVVRFGAGPPLVLGVNLPA